MPNSAFRAARRNARGLFALLYANSHPRVATYLPLAKAIEEAGHTAFLGHPHTVPIPREELDAFGIKSGLMLPEEIQEMEGIDVFFSSEVVQYAPRDGYSVRLFHSLPDDGLNTNYAARLGRNPYLATTADYLAIAVKQSPRRWSPQNYEVISEPTPLPAAPRRDRLDIVPAGYPKIEYLTHHIQFEGTKKYLMYCPTSSGGAVGSRVVAYGREILRALLDRFPEYTIVFRPYPSGDVRKLMGIKEEFSRHPRFGFDNTLTGISFLKETALVVTDHSSIAVSFSLATGRPSVFFNDDVAKPVAEIDPLGYRTSSVNQILESVRNGLLTLGAWRSKILNERAEHLYNAGSASSYLASKLPIFASGGTDPDWLSIPRERLYVPQATHAPAGIHCQ